MSNELSLLLPSELASIMQNIVTKINDLIFKKIYNTQEMLQTGTLSNKVFISALFLPITFHLFK